MSDARIFYSGIGADKAISELNELVGKITANWAAVEDILFRVFVVVLADSWPVKNIGPYRAVFFTFGSYEGKMRMVHNAMKTRYAEDRTIMVRWEVLRKSLNGFAKLRNEIAHLIPMAKSFTDPSAKACVRLVPAFWKSSTEKRGFNQLGYSIDELWQALKPYWGYHPRWNADAPKGEESFQLGFRLEQFAISLEAPHQPQPISL